MGLARLRELLPTLAVALLSGAAGVAGSYAIAGFRPSFLVAPIAGFMARVLPGSVITFAIVVLGDLGDQLNLLTAFALAATLLAATSLVAVYAGRRLDDGLAGAALAVALGALVAFAVTSAPAPSAGAGLAAGAVVAAGELGRTAAVPVPAGVSDERRRVLGSLAGTVGFVVAGTLLGRRGESHGGTAQVGSSVVGSQEGMALLGEADEKSLDVGGLEPLVSPDFYEVDINAIDPDLDAEEWTLSITGAVEEETTFDYEELTAMASEEQFNTLRCVGEQLNGEKMDNALWTGVPVMDIIEAAGLELDECCVMLRAADGFFEEFPLSALEDGFLAYGMNGRVLPRGHGYPVRALIPGHWGEINVKWLTEIEVLESEQDGYWENRGWHGTGPVETVAKLHAVNHHDDGTIEVAGHAYAGTRGIERVEVSTDGGDTWTGTTLSEPLPGDDVWRQWTHTYDSPGDEHEVVVRATDGTGQLQPSEEASPYPSGPSGWVSMSVDP